MKSHLPLPPIKTLFEESLVVLKKSALNQFLIQLIGLFFGFGVLVGGVIVVLVWIFSGIIDKVRFSIGPYEALQIFLSQKYPLMITGVYIFIAIIFGIVINGIIKTATIIAVSKSKEGITVGEAIRKAIPLVWPIILLNIIVGVVLIGGFFVFIIPSIIFALFFAFAPFELIISKKKPVEAMKGSFQIVTSHFGDILLRVLAFLGMYLVIGVVVPGLLTKLSLNSQIFSGLYSFIINCLLSWYGISYSIVLYQQVKKGSVKEKLPSITWVWVVTALGMVIGLLIVAGGGMVIRQFTPIWQSEIKKAILKEQFHPRNRYRDQKDFFENNSDEQIFYDTFDSSEPDFPQPQI